MYNGGESMRRYDIYLIEDEFALHYFQKEHLMYQLFMEYNQAENQRDACMKKQIEYITKAIPVMQLQWMMERQFAKDANGKVLSDMEYEYQTETSRARLQLAGDFVFMQAEGTVEAETVFFELLRKLNPCFLAMNYRENVYGWLNPVKQRKFCIK
jgi:hypothetical protein